MKSGQVFELDVVGFDRKKPDKSGVIHHYRAILLQEKKAEKSDEQLSPKEWLLSGKRKKPNHFKWYTRNIRIITNDNFQTDIIRKIHIPLIVSFNNQTVVP
ncbi:MAG: hypothetical protein AAFO07_28750 [Bacteroidota bacterium]